MFKTIVYPEANLAIQTNPAVLVDTTPEITARDNEDK
jgi:hypothetical protein